MSLSASQDETMAAGHNDNARTIRTIMHSSRIETCNDCNDCNVTVDSIYFKCCSSISATAWDEEGILQQLHPLSQMDGRDLKISQCGAIHWCYPLVPGGIGSEGPIAGPGPADYKARSQSLRGRFSPAAQLRVCPEPAYRVFTH